MSAADWVPASLLPQAKPLRDDDMLVSQRSIFARTLADILSATAARPVEVAAGPVQMLRLNEWQASQNPFGAVMQYDSLVASNQIALHLPGFLISQLLDIHYGGNGQLPSQSNFSAAEMKFVERLGTRFELPLSQFFGPTDRNDLQLTTLVSSLLNFQPPSSREQICLMPFFVESAGLKSATINIWVAVGKIGKLVEASTARNAAATPVDAGWQQALQSAALDIPVSASAVLSRSQIAMDRLLTLTVGDILPILVRPTVPLVAGGQQIAVGTIGEANRMAAFKIESIEGNLQ